MLKRIKQVYVKRQVGNAQRRVNFLNCGTARHFAGALGVFDVHPEKDFHNYMETTAGEPPNPCLRLMKNCAGQPAGTNDAISSVAQLHKIVKSARR
jgi:hypothetical protein